MTDDIHRRLRRLREEHGLSLRQMARRVANEGQHPVSHDSVRHYEEGRGVPSDYLVAVCSTFEASPEWLLFGRGSMRARPDSEAAAALEAVGDIVHAYQSEKTEWLMEGWTRATRRRWQEFVATLSGDDPIKRMSVESWRPPPERENDSSEDPSFHRVGIDERRSRAEAVSLLLECAEPHQDWLDLLFRDIPHVVSLVDVDGIIVQSRSSDGELAKEWRMQLGFDWSEEVMGVNGAGSALASDELSAVIGTRKEPFHNFACLAAPLHDAADAVVGALNLSAKLPDADPSRMTTVAYSARMIEKDMVDEKRPSRGKDRKSSRRFDVSRQRVGESQAASD